MVWFEEPDEQKAQQWQSRIAQQRLDLSASVEAALGDSSLPPEEEEWVEEAKNTASVSQRCSTHSPASEFTIETNAYGTTAANSRTGDTVHGS